MFFFFPKSPQPTSPRGTPALRRLTMRVYHYRTGGHGDEKCGSNANAWTRTRAHSKAETDTVL